MLQKLNSNPIDPRMEIHAYAGPMNKEEASVFRKKWKTPPRMPVSYSFSATSSPTNRTPTKLTTEFDFRLQDTEKGLERVGRDLARKFNVGWREYWPFLDTFTDLTSKEGLSDLESYLKNRFLNAYSEFAANKLNEIKNDVETTANSSSSVSKSFITSPMSELCKHFEACSLADNSTSKVEQCSTKIIHPTRNDYVFEAVTKAGLSPSLCIEKSCHVFANRILYHVLHQMNTVTSHTLDVLESDIKHLKSLISNFMEDPAFINIVNFQSVHSRIAQLISYEMKQVLTFEDELKEKTVVLENVIQKYDKMVDLFSSDDEDLNNYRQPIRFVRKKSTSDSKQVICLVENILKSLEQEPENEFINANSEEDCLKAWANTVPCACVWKANKSSKRGSFNKKNNSSKLPKPTYSRSQPIKSLDSVSRKLSFLDDEIGM